MSLLEDRILRIIELKQVGKSEVEIASELRTSPLMIRSYEEGARYILLKHQRSSIEIAKASRFSFTAIDIIARHYGIPLNDISPRKGREKSIDGIRQGDIALPGLRKSKWIRKEQIDDALVAGVRSMDELVEKLGSGHKIVYNFCWRHEIIVPFRLTTKPDSEKIGILRATCTEERITLDVLCKKTGYSPQMISRMAGRCHITLPPAIKEQIKMKSAKPEYDVLITQGVPLRDIAEQVGCTYQNVNQYIHRTGQHEVYKQRRKEIGWHGHNDTGSIIPISFRKHYLFLLEERITQLCKKKGFAYEKAWKYVQACNVNQSTPFKELVQFFDNYNYSQKIIDQFGGLEEAKWHGVKPLSLAELCEPFGWAVGYTGRILRKVGLEPLYGKLNIPSRKVSLAKKKRILSCFDSPLSQVDLAYFAGIHGASVQQYFSKKKVVRHTKYVKTFDTFHGEHVLTYRLASQIYEADDAGFNQGEIESYAGIHATAVQYALEHRAEITPVIVDVLKKLYPTEKITSPYRYKYGIEEVIEQELLQR